MPRSEDGSPESHSPMVGGVPQRPQRTTHTHARTTGGRRWGLQQATGHGPQRLPLIARGAFLLRTENYWHQPPP